MELLNKNVRTKHHEGLCSQYYFLEGTIIDYENEEESKRNSQGDPVATGKSIEKYYIKFLKVKKGMCEGLWLSRDMFEVI